MINLLVAAVTVPCALITNFGEKVFFAARPKTNFVRGRLYFLAGRGIAEIHIMRSRVICMAPCRCLTGKSAEDQICQKIDATAARDFFTKIHELSRIMQQKTPLIQKGFSVA
jgi:hypothetical protein